MGKRVVIWIFLMSMVAMGFWFLIYDAYNLDVVKVCSDQVVKASVIDESSIAGYIKNYTVEYRGRSQDFELIMVSGDLRTIKDETLLEGMMISASEPYGIVIGDEVANRYFKQATVLGETFSIEDQDYTIIGVVKNSEAVYIYYQEKLLSELSWSVMNVHAEFKLDKNIEGKTEQLQKAISGYARPEKVVIYKDVSSVFTNLALVGAILLLLKLMQNIFNRFMKRLNRLKMYVQIEHRGLTFFQMAFNQIKSILLCFATVLSLGIALWGGLKLIRLIHIPYGFKPMNIMSLLSYVAVLENQGQILKVWLSEGFPDIVIATTGGLMIMSLIGFLLDKILRITFSQD